MLPGYTSGTNNSWKTNVKFYYEGLVILDLIGTIFSLLDALISTSNFHSQNVLADLMGWYRVWIRSKENYWKWMWL